MRLLLSGTRAIGVLLVIGCVANDEFTQPAKPVAGQVHNSSAAAMPAAIQPLTTQERSLLERIVAHVGPDKEVAVRGRLLNNRQRIELIGQPQLQILLDSFYTARSNAARARTIARAKASGHR